MNTNNSKKNVNKVELIQKTPKSTFQLPNLPKFSEVIYGVWRLADRPEENSAEKALSKISACLELGMTTFDHADIYGDYTCEDLFGRAVELGKIPRDAYQIITKCGIKLISPNRPEHKIKSYDTSSKHIENSVNTSLKNLKTDYLDVLLIHRPNPMIDLAETAEGLEKVVRSGKVRAVGVSNFEKWQFEQLQESLSIPLVTNQIECSVINLDPFHDGILGQCQLNGIRPMAWSPLGGGSLFNDDKYSELRSTLQEIGNSFGTESFTIDQVALAFLLNHPSKILPIIGTNNISRIKAAATATTINLTEEQMHAIWSASKGIEVP